MSKRVHTSIPLVKLKEENCKCKTRLKKTETENVTVWQKLNDSESNCDGLRKEAFLAKDMLKAQERKIKAKVEKYEKMLRLHEERSKKLEAHNLELKRGSAKLRRRIRDLERAQLTGEPIYNLEIDPQVSGFSRNPCAEFQQ
jgi:hypothetical protein